MCVLFCVNGYVRTYMCRCVPGGQKRKFDLLGIEVTGICEMPSLLCGCWNWNRGPLDYAASVFFFSPAESYLSSFKNCSCSRRFVLLDFGTK